MLGVRSSSPGRRSWSRVQASVVLVLFALGWIADRAHTALERHAWCDEHQRVEHQDSAADVDEHLAEHGASDDGRGPSIEALDTDSAEHAACCVLLARTKDPLALPNARTSPSCILLPTQLGRAPPPITTPISTIPLLLLAPKQSPPVI